MFYSGIKKGAAALYDIGKIHKSKVGQTKNDIQISKAGVAVQAEHAQTL